MQRNKASFIQPKSMMMPITRRCLLVNEESQFKTKVCIKVHQMRNSSKLSFAPDQSLASVNSGSYDNEF